MLILLFLIKITASPHLILFGKLVYTFVFVNLEYLIFEPDNTSYEPLRIYYGLELHHRGHESDRNIVWNGRFIHQ